ncbi:MAG TPA: hypothetical protein VK203_04625 [Nostocaceae cyanobacterium]|nr:hypothetical protein [Nostocaceae cyanobacterium]
MVNPKGTDKSIDSAKRVELDTYDRGIIPAETAARKEREGDKYKHIPTEENNANAPTDDQTNAESIHTTHGYTVDREGLLNNYAVEPEMYYEVPGDARQEIIADRVQRLDEIQHINEDETGRLTDEIDLRGKGTGII